MQGARIVVVGLALALSYPTAEAAQAPCGWHAVEGAPGGRIDALFVHDDGNGPGLYVGGLLDGLGAEAAHVVRYDGGGRWSALGSGVNAPVRAFATFTASQGAVLVVIGDFTVAGGQPAAGIAFYDGAVWTAPPASGLAKPRAAVQRNVPGGATLVVVGDATPGGRALSTWDGGTWTMSATTNSQLTDVAVHEGTLLAAGPFGIESWTSGVHAVATPSEFFPSRFARLPGENGERFVCIGAGFEVQTVGLPPVPKGRAVQVRDAGAWVVADTNVAAAHFAEWHDVRFAVAWQSPAGPTAVLAGDFVRQSGTWIENEGFAYAATVVHGDVPFEALLPMPARLGGNLRALVAYDEGGGERLFAGGIALASAGVALGSLAVLDACATSAPSWHEVPGCAATEVLSSPYDQPVLGTPFELEARSETGMLAEAWLAIGLATLSDGAGCGIPIGGIGELLVDDLLVAGGGPVLLPGFYSPFGPTATIAKWTLGLPAEPALVGLGLTFQALSRDIVTGEFRLSTALDVSLGN